MAPLLLQPLQPDRSPGDRLGARVGPGFRAGPRSGGGRYQLEGEGRDRSLSEEAASYPGRPPATA